MIKKGCRRQIEKMQLEYCVEEKFRKKCKILVKISCEDVWIFREGINYCKDIHFFLNGKNVRKDFLNTYSKISFFLTKIHSMYVCSVCNFMTLARGHSFNFKRNNISTKQKYFPCEKSHLWKHFDCLKNKI